MPVDTQAMLRAAEIVAEGENMKVAVQCSAAGAVVTGITTLIGGLLAGPIGLAIGGTVGGVGSMLATDGKFRSVVTIIQEDLTYQQQFMLAQEISTAFRDVDVTDAVKIALMITDKSSIYFAIADILKNFFLSEMKMAIKN